MSPHAFESLHAYLIYVATYDQHYDDNIEEAPKSLSRRSTKFG